MSQWTQGFLLFAAAALCGSVAQGKSLTETQIYKRCYAQLTESALPLNDARMSRVRSKAVSGAQACVELLNEGKFDANGRLVNITPTSVKIVKTFNSIHRSWFTATRLEDISDFDYDINPNTGEVFDQTEQSLFLTRFLFTPNLHYRNMLRGNRGVRALRQEDTSVLVAPFAQKFNVPNVGRYIWSTNMAKNPNKFAFQRADIITRDLYNQYSGQDMSVYVNLPMMTAGEVIGVIPNDFSAVVPNFSFDKGSTNYSAIREFGANNVDAPFDIYKNRGGGLIGASSFFLMNSGHPNGTKFDGQLKVPRTWSKAIMESLLCSQIPSLRFEDVTRFVDVNSSTSFRQSRTCVRCHATLDPMAYTTRNMIVANGHGALSGVTQDRNSKYTMLVGGFTPNLPTASGWPSQAQANFFRQEPKGTLRFRTSSGALIEKDVNNLEELGQGLSDNEDYFRCAAKRYFKHFTGIEVSLHDPTNPENAGVNAQQTPTTLADRKFVEDLASRLQAGGSLSNLVQEILQSTYYRHSNFRPEGN